MSYEHFITKSKEPAVITEDSIQNLINYRARLSFEIKRHGRLDLHLESERVDSFLKVYAGKQQAV